MLFGTVPVERKERRASRIGHREKYSSSTAAPAIASVHLMESLKVVHPFTAVPSWRKETGSLQKASFVRQVFS